MSTQHIETLIIGAGQAGLSTAYHLQRLGRECLVVDAHDRVGDNWRHLYDSLALFTPAMQDGLDGLPFPAGKWDFPTKDEFADYLELYAMTFDLPVRLGTRVTRLAQQDGRFVADLGGHQLSCDNVVISTGTFGRTPRRPAFADELAPQVHQVHSFDYRRPADLPDGPVLVVGASHSGLDIAHELGATRPTTLVGPTSGRVPFEWGTPGFKAGYPVLAWAFKHVLTRRTPMGRKAMRHLRFHGAPQLRIKDHHLAERGVEWIQDHVAGVSADGLPQLADGRTFDVAAVVWATGFRQDYDWLDLPVRIEDGWPVEYRGVVAEVPGLFFCGLAFQYAFASMEIGGVGRDAAHIARCVAARVRSAEPAASTA